MNLSFRQQKYIFISILIICNVALAYCITKLHKYWYLYLIIMTPNSLLSISMIITITISGFIKIFYKKEKHEIKNKNIIYLIPCYNESFEELDETVKSFTLQEGVESHNKILIICCDGMIQGKGNDRTTDKILTELILKKYIIETKYYENAYITWEDVYNNVYLSYGKYENLPFILIVKENNVGKRDSVTLIRRNLFLFNNKFDNNIINEPYNNITDFNKKLFNIITNYNINKIDAIIGTDGDTIIDKNCAYHLITDLYNFKDNSLIGVAGFIKISPYMSKWSPWTIYQHTSYIYGQVLTRLHQSKITRKVNCLPGCVQILKVCKESCGSKILNTFNKLPNDNDPIYKHMRAHMGEDRMHICSMMHMYPYVKTKQSIKAFAYTRVPDSWKVFLSQRRRWNLGANSNKLILVTNSGINLYEKISTIFSMIAWFLTTFFVYATIHIIFTLVNLNYWEFNGLIYFTVISIIIIISVPKLYLLTVPFWLKLNKTEIIQLYIGIIFWHLVNIPMVLIVHIYTLINMDDLKWGKTREVEKLTKDNELLEIKIDKNNIKTPDNYIICNTPKNLLV